MALFPLYHFQQHPRKNDDMPKKKPLAKGKKIRNICKAQKKLFWDDKIKNLNQNCKNICNYYCKYFYNFDSDFLPPSVISGKISRKILLLDMIYSLKMEIYMGKIYCQKIV